MQLDQTHVTIRARTLTEISDLAMVMIRAYPSAALFGFVLGAAPWALMNGLLLGWIPIHEYRVPTYDSQMASELTRYLLLMATLVFLQTPVAGVFTTLYIGQAVFESRPTWRSVLREARASFWRWFLVLAIYRGPVPIMAILWLNWGQPLSFGVDYFWPLLFALIIMILRSNRPFMPEIVLLERCPLLAKRHSPVITANRRSGALHRPVAGELFGRFVAIAVLLAGMSLLGLCSLLSARGVLFGVWEWDVFVYLVLYPLALWAAGALSVLIRFLSYLDTRIRLEGWEVQLAVRAEAIRQFGDGTGPTAKVESVVKPSSAGSAEPKRAPVAGGVV